MPLRRKTAELRREWNSEENKDVVIFHIFPRNPLAPSMSPYVLKLETFLRMHNIQYKIDTQAPMHPTTKKCPWITFNGEDVADSQQIMEFLTNKLSITPKYDLEANPKDKVFVRGLRSIIEDHFNFCVMSKRMVHGKYEDVAPFFPTLINVKMVQNFIAQRIMKSMGEQAKAQGIGRLPKETVLKMANEDLEAISLALGKKNFMMGDEPSEIDCTVFAFLVLNLDDFSGRSKKGEEPSEDEAKGGEKKTEGEEQTKETSSKAVETDEPDKYENLRAYVPRIKQKLWSDWDDICKEAEEALQKKEKIKKSEEKEDNENAKENDLEGGASKPENSTTGENEEKKDKEK